MRNYTAMSVVMAILVASVIASRASAARRNGAPENSLQGMRDVDLASIMGSAEVPYPSRPNIFKSPVELRQYLDALNAYYAIAGRPRFGKRDGALPHGASHEDFFDY